MPAAKPTTVPQPDTALVRRARKINRVLAQTYPDATTELDFDNPFELLVVTVLSAQTTDRRVNAVRPTLFAAYPDARAMAQAPREHLEEIVGSLGFFRAKTDALLKLSAALVENHHGRLVRRFGWTSETDPVKVEHAIGALFPSQDWTLLSHHVIWHGRRICHAKKPACGACPVARWCPSFGEGPTDPAEAAKLVRTQGPA